MGRKNLILNVNDKNHNNLTIYSRMSFKIRILTGFFRKNGAPESRNSFYKDNWSSELCQMMTQF